MKHTTGLDSMRSIAMLVFTIFVLIGSQYMFNKLPLFTNSRHFPRAILAVLGGVVVAIVAYLPIKYLYGDWLRNESYAINLSVLLGVVTCYLMISGIESQPDIPTIALLVFMFYYQVQKFVM